MMRYLENVTTLDYMAYHCKGCERCVQVCPHGVFEMKNDKAKIVDRNACIECGACAKNCAFGAISVKPGVGCASAIIRGFLTNSEPSCDCSGDSGGGCC